MARCRRKGQPLVDVSQAELDSMRAEIAQDNAQDGYEHFEVWSKLQPNGLYTVEIYECPR